ncbi:HAD-IA family hydrolase [Colwellia sp. RSH04]|uniref:HAD-IA family hydrolase n=1 Tax=Colwellia sp. RSH04 TaxID=2305464 RepID=UPI000E57AD0F|nr:HAD-IA family hydrolase [Colwellia sp. RSH04]RHW75823.1 HAD family hydrolase [Colwellia sp. RSH04]
MKFYRRLKPFKAISFDLDDTLYSNGPVMRAIDIKMVEYFAQLMPKQTQIFDVKFWLPFRHQAIQQHNALQHDVVAVRFESYRLGFIALNYSQVIACNEAQAALDYFIRLRSDFSVPQVSHDLLAQLSDKLPLVAITNGNVDAKAIGIARYFSAIYHAGFQTNHLSTAHQGNLFRQKPRVDMFAVACEQLNIKPEELLHVGDCGNADILGGITAGCQTAWLPKYGVGKAIKNLPHIELTDVSDLLRLI